ncbi:MAG: GNAT family N-acetyltransferase [bacterium]
MPSYPFLSPEFLDSLERSGSVCEETGWTPIHLTGETDGQQWMLPLYQKDHSWGEFVFDFAWADAYRNHGLAYYPKLVTAIPFTPCAGPRMSCDTNLSQSVCHSAIQAVLQKVEAQQASSWHLLFPNEDELAMWNHPELLHRTGIQYHWFNQGYHHFDEFLSALKSRKRKMIRREREGAVTRHLEIKRFGGNELEPELWRFFYHLYLDTYLKRSGTAGYLNEQFFDLLSQCMADQLTVIIAFQGGSPVAGSLFFQDQNTLYGRYWGCLKDFQFLHFELCYYQGIELAIDLNLKRFDAGAQGEHKLARGFHPRLTHSLHYIRQPGFRAAIADFLKRERRHVDALITHAATLLPYRSGDTHNKIQSDSS